MKSFSEDLKNLGSTLSASKKADNQVLNHTKQVLFQNCLDWIIDMLAHPDKHAKRAIIVAPEGVASAGQFLVNVTKLGWHVTDACCRVACGDVEAIGKVVGNSLQAYQFLEEKVPQVTARLEKLTLDYIDFCKLSIENSDEACKIIHQQQANAHALLDSVNDMLEKTDKVKFTETATKFGVECGTFHYGFKYGFKLIGHMGNWTYRGLSNGTNRFIKLFEKTKMPEAVATTPEGLTVAMSEMQEALRGAESIEGVFAEVYESSQIPAEIKGHMELARAFQEEAPRMYEELARALRRGRIFERVHTLDCREIFRLHGDKFKIENSKLLEVLRKADIIPFAE